MIVTLHISKIDSETTILTEHLHFTIIEMLPINFYVQLKRCVRLCNTKCMIVVYFDQRLGAAHYQNIQHMIQNWNIENLHIWVR